LLGSVRWSAPGEAYGAGDSYELSCRGASTGAHGGVFM
jgi:hypothetical protein